MQASLATLSFSTATRRYTKYFNWPSYTFVIDPLFPNQSGKNGEYSPITHRFTFSSPESAFHAFDTSHSHPAGPVYEGSE